MPGNGEQCLRYKARCSLAVDKFSHTLPPAMLWLQDIGPSALMGYICLIGLTLPGKYVSFRAYSLCCAEEFGSRFPLLCLEVSKPTAVYLDFFSEKSTGLCH